MKLSCLDNSGSSKRQAFMTCFVLFTSCRSYLGLLLSCANQNGDVTVKVTSSHSESSPLPFSTNSASPSEALSQRASSLELLWVFCFFFFEAQSSRNCLQTIFHATRLNSDFAAIRKRRNLEEICSWRASEKEKSVNANEQLHDAIHQSFAALLCT